MAANVTQGTETATFGYDPEHNRAALTNSLTGATTWYLNYPAAGVATEYVPGTPVWRDYLKAYGHIVAERFVAGSTVSPSYFVGDHLASTTVLSDTGQNQQEYDSWDVWGKRRKPNGNSWNGCFASNPKSLTLRGYTGQEMLDTYCLVNLNARLYDPSIGRMTSADSIVPDPMNGQAFN